MSEEQHDVKKPVRIVSYNREWPRLYEEERTRILTATGDRIIAIEHVGSTAVPGLGAKPIIDIMAGVQVLADAEVCIEPLEEMGYEYVPEYEDVMPERRYFRKGPPKNRTHHLHMVEVGSDFWERHLLFRDHLRAEPETAQAYYELKVKLAAEFGSDRDGYTDAKSAFIEAVVTEARTTQNREAAS